MKRTALYIILLVSLSLAFTQKKPCCKNKAGKTPVSCKFNQAAIEKKSGVAEVIDEAQLTSNSGKQCQRSEKSAFTEGKSCSNCTKKPWWKFWAKKNCCNVQAG